MATGWSFNADGLTHNDGTNAWTTAVARAGRTFHMKLEGTVNAEPGATVSSAPTMVTEGSTATYTVVLDSQPTANVTITPTSSDTTSVTTSAALTFTTTDWDMAQMVTLTGEEDANAIPESVTITHAVNSTDTDYSAITIDSFTVMATENDSASVTVSKTSLSLTEEGTGDTYTLVLGTQPAPMAPVTITPSSLNTKLMFNPTSVSFNDTTWNQPAEVTVTAGADDDLVNESSSITHAVTGYGASAAAISVTVMDNDTASVKTSTTSVNVGEGSTSTYTIVLEFKPSADVTVTIVDPVEAGTDVTTDPEELEFTTANWNMPQEVTVTAGPDVDTTNDTATVTHTTSSTDGNYNELTTVSDVIVTVIDDDDVGVSFDPTALTIFEDSTDGSVFGTYDVNLNSAPTANVTITPTRPSTQPGEQSLTISPPTLLFTPHGLVDGEDGHGYEVTRRRP